MMNSLTFQFHDGCKIRTADPMAVVLRLAAEPLYRPALIDEAIYGNQAATREISRIVASVFNVQPLTIDGRGMTRLDCVRLMHRFERWLSQLEPNQGNA